jgi:hypothetical protein
MKKVFLASLLLASMSAMATNTYDGGTGILKLDSVIYQNTKYTNVVMKLTEFNIISVGSTGSLAALCPSTSAVDTLDASTNILNLNQVQYSNNQYNDVVLKLTGFQVQSIGASTPLTPPTGPVNETCADENFTPAKFNAISLGMTIDQVNQTIGCKFEPLFNINGTLYSSRQWQYLNPTTFDFKYIAVSFDATGSIVNAKSSPFKIRKGF